MYLLWKNEVVVLKLSEAIKTGRKLAEYFVYCCGEGEHYVELINHLRVSNTRSNVLTAICILLRYGRLHLKNGIEGISKKKMEELFHFIREGKKEEVSRFHTSLSTYISTIELEKIREQERYLLRLLS
jgi:hypothetical protein